MPRQTQSKKAGEETQVVDAHPTKDLFIEMLIKDIPLTRAIIDLADNCVDGARRLRGDGPYSGLFVAIEASSERFLIRDNCGGIRLDWARNYAFRFGRPSGAPTVQHSVGQFGVGMKRALFKLGERFRVESTAERSFFALEVDVEKWRKTDRWEFDLAEPRQGLKPLPLDKRGTIITVTELHENVAADLASPQFITRLSEELREAQLRPLEHGLAVTLNGVALTVRPISLFQSKELLPAQRKLDFPRNGRGGVTALLYAGICDANAMDAGWYVFCNGRLVLGSDQSVVTGWGENRERTIPKYHPQFARFRGYAFLEANDAALLPWNTTKTGVDVDSPIYKKIRLEMINITRPVIDFLNKLKEERERRPANADSGPLEAAVENAPLVPLASLETAQVFTAPKPIRARQGPEYGRIQYLKPAEQINRVKEVLQVATMREVGESTFDYFFDRECGE